MTIFVELPEEQNPLGNREFDVGGHSAPVFADIDGDGDLDAFIGQYSALSGTTRDSSDIEYLRNDDGIFTQIEGSENPLDDIQLNDFYGKPAFADIDEDGDLDAFIGNASGNIEYFQNEDGVFTEVIGADNPLNVDIGLESAPTFADIDGDGDLDAFIGDLTGNINYFENNGNGSFIELTGASNPLAGVDRGSYATPAFVDADDDEDLDVFIGTEIGDINYFQNDSGVFNEVAVEDNPFNVIYRDLDINFSTPTFADINGDGNLEAIVGQRNGRFRTFTTDIPAPTPENESEDIAGDVVYRFFETNGQTQFYTTSEVERDSVIADLANYEYEGESFVGAPNLEENDITGVTPVYRLFNTSTGVHLYTADENERNFVVDNLSNYTSEGISYYGYESQQEGTVPLYRFYNQSLDAHFYTPSIAERDTFIASPDYQPEGSESGIAFYVQPVEI